jgi:hypothetical protein
VLVQPNQAAGLALISPRKAPESWGCRANLFSPPYASRSAKECPFRGKLRRTRYERMFSGLPM